MTTSFATNSNNDLFISANGLLSIVTGQSAVQQNCVTAVQAQLGEMIYAMNQGMPTRQTLWDRYNPQAFIAAARQVITGVDGVISIQQFTVSKEGDQFTYFAQIMTIYGSAEINGNI